MSGEAGGGVVDWSDAGGGVVVESGGVVLAGGGGVDDIDELSPLGEVDGEVDCCFEQAAKASNALRDTNIRLRFIGSPHCGSAHFMHSAKHTVASQWALKFDD